MKLLLVDDHPLFGVGFSHALVHARPGTQVLTALTLPQGLELAQRSPDLDAVLVDFRLGGDDGLDGLRRFGEQHPCLARVLISAHEDPALAQRARAAGAAAFLGKSLGIEPMRVVLEHVCRGGEHFDIGTVTPHGMRMETPTARQLEVLSWVARGRQNKQIAHELGIAERTVKLHLTALFDALRARNRTHLLVRARETGFL